MKDLNRNIYRCTYNNVFYFTKSYIQQEIHYCESSLGNIKYHKFTQAEKGFSLVEALVALVIMIVIFTVMGPLFLNQRLQNINNEIRIGAVTLSQHILDSLRQKPINSIPSSGSDILITTLTSSPSPTNTLPPTTVLTVASVSGFVIGEPLVVGSDRNTYTIQSINPNTNQITLTTLLATNQVAGAAVKLTSLGYSYDVTISYCPPDSSLPCDFSSSSNSSRNVRVQVNYNGNQIYKVETFYTQLK